jgi:hypothetical protein
MREEITMLGAGYLKAFDDALGDMVQLKFRYAYRGEVKEVAVGILFESPKEHIVAVFNDLARHFSELESDDA